MDQILYSSLRFIACENIGMVFCQFHASYETRFFITGLYPLFMLEFPCLSFVAPHTLRFLV